MRAVLNHFFFFDNVYNNPLGSKVFYYSFASFRSQKRFNGRVFTVEIDQVYT